METWMAGVADDDSAGLKQLRRSDKKNGYVLFDEIDRFLPSVREDGPELDDILSELARSGIEVAQEPKEHEQDNAENELLGEHELQELSQEAGSGPVLMYRREALTVPHLTHEQEIELAKRISGCAGQARGDHHRTRQDFGGAGKIHAVGDSSGGKKNGCGKRRLPLRTEGRLKGR